MTQRFRINLAATATTAAALVLTACGSSSKTTNSAPSSTSRMGSMSTSNTPMTTMSGTSMSMSTSAAAGSATGPHNAADVSFATDMIPHHAQAVMMADMALTRATNAKVKALATAIKAAQDPEITEMSGWLTSWNKPVPATMGGMNMSHGTGMMSDADMAKLAKATGATFDRLWVQMMITHHEGAITMAKTETTDGQNAAAKKLAGSIVTSQSAQLQQLKTLLTQLPKA